MEKTAQLINKYLVAMYNDIQAIEESALRAARFNDISVKELHVIEAIGVINKKTMTEIAKILEVTLGTLTVAVNNLERKDYVIRLKDENDKRIVKLSLTKKGRLLYRLHYKFHFDMVKSTIQDLNQDEMSILAKALENLHKYLKSRY